MSPPNPEAEAREAIDTLLEAAGWSVQNRDKAAIHATRGVAIREFPLKHGHGFADYLLYVDSQAAGVIEAKKQGVTLSGVETQAEKYTTGLPDGLPHWHNPLPFAYQSTGVETRFTNGLDPDPRARRTFAFHRPEYLASLLDSAKDWAADGKGEYGVQGKTFLERLRHMPKLIEEWGQGGEAFRLWPAQIKAITGLENSLRENRPRALVQMATGSGKTFTAISLIYRLVKFAGARRVLFLVDRGNLADQTLKEFKQYVSPYNNYKFTEEFIVQRLGSNQIDHAARVSICTIQRLYSMLKGKDIDVDDEEKPVEALVGLSEQDRIIEYNPKIPIEEFDVIITDECHRSIYNLWAQVLEYFDAYLIGLTATPNKQTFGFFNQNLVMEYGHEQAVADGVNVNYDVFRIKTEISEQGSKVDAGYSVQRQEKDTRKRRWEQLDEDLEYEARQLDRDVVTPDQIRTVIKTFKDSLFTKIYPGRTWVPKTLIFAKDDAHAENIVEIVRDVFGKGNTFCQKITYRVTGRDPKQLIKDFQTDPEFRIAVTVDMIATGTDIKACEIVFFMRSVKSRSFFEQMKGRGVRIMKPTDLRQVTPDAEVKDHFVIVDAVGITEQEKTDSRPLERKPTVSFEKLMEAVTFGSTDPDVISSLAGRLSRMEHRHTEEDDKKIRAATGYSLNQLAAKLVSSLDPDRAVAEAINKREPGTTDEDLNPAEIEAARVALVQNAAKPFTDPKTRELLEDIRRKNEITIDVVSQDNVIEADFTKDGLDRAKGLVQSFEQYIQDNKDEITALQILYNRSYKQRLDFAGIVELHDRISAPPYLWTEQQLWQAYAAIERDKVKPINNKKLLTNLVSLVRFALHQENELVPFPERVNANFQAWLAQQHQLPSPSGRGAGGEGFTPEQLHWLEMIRDHIAANLGIEPDDFEYAPFAQEGGLGKVHQLFGGRLNDIIEELNRTLAA